MKRSKNFNTTYSIISNLTRNQYKEVLKFLGTIPNSKTRELRSKIIKELRKEGLTYNDLTQKFKKIREKRINTELKMIHISTKEVLLFDHLLEKTLNNSKVFLNKFRLLKDIPFIMLIRKNGSIKPSEELINRNIRIAEEYELYDELSIYLQMLLDISYYSQSDNKIGGISNYLNEVEEKNSQIKLTIQTYEKYMSSALIKSNSDLKTLSKNAQEIINDCFEKTNSPRVEQYLHLINMERALVIKDYNFGFEAGFKLLTLLSNNNHLYSHNRVSNALCYLAHNQLSSLDFNSSIELSRIGLNFSPSKNISYFVALEYQLISFLFLERYNDVQVLLTKKANLPILSSYPFYYSKFKYYQAVLLFAQERFDDAWRIFSQHFELEKDKEGWRVWLSIMRIICQIERKEFVEVDMQIQSFKKYIKRWEQKSEIRERDKLIFRVIEALNKYHFDFEQVAKEEDELLTVIAYPKGDLRWEPNSPELILFHDWFRSKLKNTAYKADFEPYMLEKSNHKLDEYLSEIQEVVLDPHLN